MDLIRQQTIGDGTILFFAVCMNLELQCAARTLFIIFVMLNSTLFVLQQVL